MTTSVETHGYTYQYSNFTFHVFHNQELNQEILNQLQQYVPGWYPNSNINQMTICAENGQGQIGIYPVERILNLFSISVKFLHEASHLQTHINGILNYIHTLIQHWVTAEVANEVRFKIAFYKPTELSTIAYTGWLGDWRFTKNVNQTICGDSLPSTLSEYATRWTFDNNYQIKKGFQSQQNLWSTSLGKMN